MGRDRARIGLAVTSASIQAEVLRRPDRTQRLGRLLKKWLAAGTAM